MNGKNGRMKINSTGRYLIPLRGLQVSKVIPLNCNCQLQVSKVIPLQRRINDLQMVAGVKYRPHLLLPCARFNSLDGYCRQEGF